MEPLPSIHAVMLHGVDSSHDPMLQAHVPSPIHLVLTPRLLLSEESFFRGGCSQGQGRREGDFLASRPPWVFKIRRCSEEVEVAAACHP